MPNCTGSLKVWPQKRRSRIEEIAWDHEAHEDENGTAYEIIEQFLKNGGNPNERKVKILFFSEIFLLN